MLASFITNLINNLTSNPMMIGGMGLVILSLVGIRYQRRRSMRTATPADYTREVASRIREQQVVKQDMETLMLQLSELARELNGQMDTRFAKLEQTIAEADQKIATLEALLRKASGSQSLDVIVGDQPASAPVEAPAQTSASKSSAKLRKPNKQSKRSELSQKPAAQSAAAEPASKAKPVVPAGTLPAETLDPRYSKIYALADQGRTPVEIAQQTGQTTGEIELILNLRKTQTR